MLSEVFWSTHADIHLVKIDGTRNKLLLLFVCQNLNDHLNIKVLLNSSLKVKANVPMIKLI